jgi:multiple sugar transport system substrate-binding protein
MMRTNKRMATILILIFALAVSLLAGCGTSGVKVETGSVKEDFTKEMVDLQIQWNYGEEEFKSIFTVKAFQAKYPNVTIKQVKKLEPEMLATGNLPDIMQVNNLQSIQQYLEDGIIIELSDLVKKHNFDLNRFEPNMLKNVQLYSGGKLYGLPRARAVHALYYNKEIFDKFGVSYPAKDKSMTWDETIELGKKLTRNEGGIQYRGLDTGLMTISLEQLKADQLESGTLEPRYSSDEKFKIWLEKVKGIFDVPEMIPEADRTQYVRTDLNNFIKDRNVAMVALWDKTPDLVAAEKEGLQWDLAPYPVFKEAPGISPMANAHHLTISVTSKIKDLAMIYLNDYFADEHQLELSRTGASLTPLANKEILNAYKQVVPEMAVKNVRAFFVNAPAEATSPMKYTGANLLAAQREVAKGHQDINTILSNMEEEARKKVAEQKSKEW